MKLYGILSQTVEEDVEQVSPDPETRNLNRAVRLIYLSLENDNENHSVLTTQMSRQESIEGDHNPSNKSTRSNTILPRAPTFSQTLQIITSRFKLSASPKLRRTRKRPLHERTIEDTHELSDNDGNYEETIPQIVEDPSETEIFFKQSITTSQVYQLDQKLDDTIPYLDPLLDSPRDSHIVVNLPDTRPPSPFLESLAQQRYTPPLLPYIGDIHPIIPGTSGNTNHNEETTEVAGDEKLTKALQESAETTALDSHESEHIDNIDLIDLASDVTPPPYIVLDSREEDIPADDWNAEDANVTEDDRETSFTTAHNTLVIDDSDDAHSDCSTEPEDQEENTGFSTPPPTPSRVVTLTSPVKTPERRGGFGDPPPWAADQNTARIDIDLTEPAATSSPKRPSPQQTRRHSPIMEQETTSKGKAHKTHVTKNSKHVNRVPDENYERDFHEETQQLLLNRQKSLPSLIRALYRYPKLEKHTLDVAIEYYRTTYNEYPLLELTKQSRDLMLYTMERVCTAFRGIPPQTLLLHSDLSTLMYTHTLSEIQCNYPNVAAHLQWFYQLMFQGVEMYEGKPCRYDDVHELIATFYPITLQEMSRHSFPSTKPDAEHYALMRPIFELNVRTIHDLLARSEPPIEATGDKRKYISQDDDNDTNTCTGNGKKITILESDLDTNTGSTDQNDSIDREPLDRTYICDKPIDYSKHSQVSGQIGNLSVQDLCDKEYIEENVKTECKLEVKVEDHDNKSDHEHGGRSRKATNHYYDVNWRHDTKGRKANSHKIPNRFSYYDLRPYRQEYTAYPVTQVPPPTMTADQRTHEFQTVVPGASRIDLQAPPQPTGSRGNNTTSGGNRPNVQRSLSTSFNLNDRGTGNNTVPQAIPNFPDLTGRNNNNTNNAVNTGMSGIMRITPQATSTPNRNAENTNAQTNLQPGDPMYDLLSRVIMVQEKQANSIAETQFRDKKFDGSKPELAHIHLTNFKSHWSRLLARQTATEDEYKKHFHDTLSGSAYEWFDKRKQDLVTDIQVQDAFLARYNKWGENRQACIDEWQSLKYPWAIPMDDFLEDLTNLAYIIEVTDEHKILTFKKSMPDEIKVHLVSCDSLSECAKTAENIINLFKRQNKIPIDAYQPDKDKQNSQAKSTQEKVNTKKQDNKKDRVNLHYEDEDLQQDQEDAFYQHSLDERDPDAQSNQGYGNPQKGNNYRGRYQNQKGYRGGRGRGNRGQQNQYGNRNQNRDSDSNKQWRQQDNSSGDRNQNNKANNRNEGYNNNNNRGYNNSRGGNRRSFESRGRGRNSQSSDRPPPTYDPNKYCEVCDKTGHMPDECFVVARFQRAKPFLSKHSVQAHKTIEQSTQQNTQPPQSFPPVYPPYPYMYPNPHAYMMHNPPPPTGLPQLTQGQTGVAPQQTQSIPPTQGNTNNSQSNLG